MFYLGIDGGGSGCRAVLADAAGTVLARAEAGPANIATDYAGALVQLQALATETIGSHPCSEVRAVLGLAGANFSGAGARIAAELPFRARVVQDVTTSVRGALGRADGIVAAIGTGSVFARQLKGEIRAIGGWGLRLGDEASGAWIGRVMLSRITRIFDGYVAPSPLSAQIAGELGGAPGIVQFSLGARPADYAAFAPRILAAARQGDTAAAHVLTEAEAEIRAAIVHLQPQDPVPVTWLGGLGEALALDDWPRRAPLGTALDGALAMAMDEATWND